MDGAECDIFFFVVSEKKRIFALAKKNSNIINNKL